jgi:hypothetical protein
MKLDPIRKEHIEEAAEIIDGAGIPKNKIHNLYWVELENGKEYPFKHLTSIAYTIANSNDPQSLDFESKPEYREYIASLGFKINYYQDQIGFFSVDEIIHFSKIRSNPYRSENPEDVKNGLKLAPLIIKLNKWADRTAPESFQVRNDKSWQWSGTFKSYLWIKIFKEGFQDKIFFNCGIDNKGLFLEFNCQRSNHSGGTTKALPQEKIDLFDKVLEEHNYEEVIISHEKLKNNGWDYLIRRSKNFIAQYEGIYDELCLIIEEDISKLHETGNSLTLTDSPAKIKSRIKDNPSFKGHKTDWSKSNAESKSIGDNGEDLALKFERNQLKEELLSYEVPEPKKALDGEGYDILSHFSDGSYKYIEVKTTYRGKEEPFYLSGNEKSFLEQYSKSYIIYRIYNYNPVLKQGKIFKISGEELLDFNYKPISFEVSTNNPD